MGTGGVGRRRHSGRNCGGEVRGPSGAPGAAIGGHLGPQWAERARCPVEGQLGTSRQKLKQRGRLGWRTSRRSSSCIALAEGRGGEFISDCVATRASES